MKKEFQSERKNVLVCGGAGFFGSNLCEYLLERYNVICVDNYSTGHESAIDDLLSHPHFEFIRHDVREPLNFNDVKELERFRLAFVGVSHVIHTAVPGAPDVIIKSPVEMMMAHSVGTKNLLELALAHHAHFLLISDGIAQNEYAQTDPCHHLAESKRFAEMLVMAYRDLYSLKTSIIRMHSCFGPRASLSDTRLVSWLVARAMSNESVALPQELKEVSLLYVADACDAVEKIMATEDGGTFDVGSTTVMPTEELLKKIEHALGLPIKRVEAFPSELSLVARFWQEQGAVAQISAVKKETGWFPIMLIDDGIQKTVDYMKSLRGVKRVTL